MEINKNTAYLAISATHFEMYFSTELYAYCMSFTSVWNQSIDFTLHYISNQRSKTALKGESNLEIELVNKQPRSQV